MASDQPTTKAERDGYKEEIEDNLPNELTWEHQFALRLIADVERLEQKLKDEKGHICPSTRRFPMTF